MVRIISCHHFRGQRIGRCEEAVGVAVAGGTIIVALEHQINIYGRSHQQRIFESEVHSRASPPPPLPGPTFVSGVTTSPTAKLMQQAAATTASSKISAHPPPVPPHLGTHEFGTPFLFSQQRGSEPVTVLPSAKKDNKGASGSISPELDTSELRLSYSFPTIDSIHTISYNEAGNYILCLEKRESASNSYVTNVRSYFHWKTDHGTKPMRARIAGLVSPTGAEPEDDSLMMVEIPLTSPATAITSCNLTGHIACLSAESIINIFLFRAKEVSGRVRVTYYDFDRTYSLETTGFIPEQIYFVSNYLACMNSEKVHVFRVRKEESASPQFASCSAISQTGGFAKTKKGSSSEGTEKVVFNPRDETIKVYLPSIVRANRKRKYITSVNISDDFQEDIHANHTKVAFSATNPGIIVEDVLRVSSSNTSSGNSHSKFLELGLYPVRVKDSLGAVALMICTKNEGFLYHLPCKPNCSAVRVASYSFTAPLISFAFDSIFFHALTDAGLESYTCRSLYYATKDHDGIKPFLNDCPLHEEPPTLAGIRPFVGVRKMTCNNTVLCLLTCSNSNSTNNKHPPAEEERAWTIYTLDLPDIIVLLDDILKTASRQEDNTSETYMTLLCEAYIALKLFMESHPGSETRSDIFSRHKDICKMLGIAYLKSSILVPNSALSSETPGVDGETTTNSTASTSATSSSTAPDSSSVSEVISTVSVDVSEDLVDKGVTYLLIGRCGVQEVFSPENWNILQKPCNIPGFIRMIEVTFIKTNEFEINPDNQKLSPTLAPVLVEFLANNNKQTLVDLVVQAPFIRESNSRRLLQILQEYAEARHYPAKETLAAILTFVTIGGSDKNTRSHVKDLLHKTNRKYLSTFLTKDVLLDTKGQQTFLTDLSICIVSDEQSQYLIVEKMFQFLKSADITLSIVMFAFSQAINVNTDSVLQHCFTKCLVTVVEKYVSAILNKAEDVEFAEEEKRAIQLLVRTYVSNINFSSNIPTPPTHLTHPTVGESHDPSKSSPIKVVTTTVAGPADVLNRSQVFGNVCSCVNFLLSIYSPGGMLTPQSQNLATAHYFMNEDSRENYIKLLSLLSNPVLSNMEGVKDIILTYLYKNATQVKPGVNPTLYIILQILAETPEKAVNLVLAKQPTTIMLFAKETFGKDPSKWQRLVTMLKHQVQNTNGSNAADADLFATILESVYLHLANTLSPHELEQVLDKETEDSQKFHSISRRVELARNYANLVITVSSDYLNHK